MRIPYGFILTSDGVLKINKDEADVISMIFDFYIAGASLGKIVNMLYAKQIPSPTGKPKWTRASVDHLLSNGNMWPSSDGRSFWMPNLRSPPAAILTMIRKVHRGKIHAMFRRI